MRSGENLVSGSEFNKEEIKKRIKQKIKERMTKELVEEVYKELQLEVNDLINEVSSLIDTEMIPTSVDKMNIKESPQNVKNTSRLIIDIKPVLKIASHSLKYANAKIPKSQWIEVIGLLAGELDTNNEKLYIKDAYPMGHGTALNAEIKDYKSYTRAYNEIKNDKLFICGWYHSHPSYGLFLSEEDLDTHSRYQKFWENAVALVIDPTQIDGRSYGFDIFKVNLELRKFHNISFEIRGALDPSVLPQLIDFINPIVDGKAIYLEYDEE